MARGDVQADASTTFDAAPADVWYLVSDGGRVAHWWPRAERAENVEGGRFTLVLRSSRDVPVRLDFRVTDSHREERQRWQQDLVNTPFARVLKRSAVEVTLDPRDDGARCSVTVSVERELVRGSWLTRVLARRAARRQAGDSLDRLKRAVATSVSSTP